MTEQEVKSVADEIVKNFYPHAIKTVATAKEGESFEIDVNDHHAVHCALIAFRMVIWFMPTLFVSTETGGEKYQQHALNAIEKELKSRL